MLRVLPDFPQPIGSPIFMAFKLAPSPSSAPLSLLGVDPDGMRASPPPLIVLPPPVELHAARLNAARPPASTLW